MELSRVSSSWNSPMGSILPDTGMWKQHELWDGTYTLDDLLDAAELIQVRRENEIRAAEAVRS